MASNPMTKKARNSFILGVLITLLIVAIAGGLIYVFVLKDKLVTTTGGKGAVAYVYKLKEGVNLESGQEITRDMVEEVKLSTNVIPADAILSRYKEKGELRGLQFEEGQKCKIALSGGTVLGLSMLYTDNLTDNSLRLVEFNMLTLPSTVSVGEYIDVRLLLPSGEDYIVLSKKSIASVKSDTIGLYLTEAEIEMISGAIIDAYTATGSSIYVAKYVEPGMQKAAQQTYKVKNSILELMQTNPNIMSEATSVLVYNNMNTNGKRDKIENTLGSYDEEETIENIKEKMNEQMEKAKDLYLQGLEGY